jgi:hypothetical protein
MSRGTMARAEASAAAKRFARALAPQSGPGGIPGPDVALRAARQLELAARGEVVAHIRRARESGHSWAAIGGLLGFGALAAGGGATVAVYAFDVIDNESVQIPGSVSTFDLRAQHPHGPFGGPMLSLVSGQYPATANQIAVTSGVASGFKLSVGSDWTVAGKTRKVTGIVQDPENLAGQFALVIPGQVTAPDTVTVLFDAPGATAGSIQSRTGLNVYTAHTVANTNEINPETT